MLFCLPYAGGGASFYRAWTPPEDMGFTLYPVQLPGREELFGESHYGDVAEAAADITGRIVETAGPGDRVSLLGHSFGAVLGYEIARQLAAKGGVELGHLVVSGSAHPFSRLGRISGDLPDDEFVARVEELAGYAHPALADPDLRSLVLPVLRSDVILHETYFAAHATALPMRITALRGQDDHIVSRSEVEGWRRASSVGSAVVELPGGHMYLADQPAQLFEVLRRLAHSEALDG
ncbi:thioesterase [Amycolatopsis coloradensis]|uniref:Thioesterase n=1 Tax=Amycolatopsis coloradensis TaxID=76021 RepID=A0A1R0KQV6_9PSEU|nr:alpha/beta fold hydrolase [Amycolatopsis coloradensis]OLZ50016.1 thioesterase [Amycolatopsis coloradensis]